MNTKINKKSNQVKNSQIVMIHIESFFSDHDIEEINEALLDLITLAMSSTEVDSYSLVSRTNIISSYRVIMEFLKKLKFFYLYGDKPISKNPDIEKIIINESNFHDNDIEKQINEIQPKIVALRRSKLLESMKDELNKN